VATAAPGSTVDGFDYVGVWAKDGATCATIGSTGATGFAVITTASFRDDTRTGTGVYLAETNGKVSLDLGGGKSVSLEQTGKDALDIDGTAMVRCTP